MKNEIIIVRNLDKIILQNKLSGYQHDSHNNNIIFQLLDGTTKGTYRICSLDVDKKSPQVTTYYILLVDCQSSSA